MLHSCDAGEYSVLSTYGMGFRKTDNEDGYTTDLRPEDFITVQYVEAIFDQSQIQTQTYLLDEEYGLKTLTRPFEIG